MEGGEKRGRERERSLSDRESGAGIEGREKEGEKGRKREREKEGEKGRKREREREREKAEKEISGRV
eukprot:208958-Amorphochlora_amoeboformis.AAC.1